MKEYVIYLLNIEGMELETCIEMQDITIQEAQEMQQKGIELLGFYRKEI